MNIFVMTGAFMTGKTTWIARMLERAASLAPTLRIAGVYTPAVFEDGAKTAINAVLLPSGERFLFAPRKQAPSGRQGGAPLPDGTIHFGWDFQDDALARINAHLATCRDCDLLVIDELGPLEMLHSQGYTEGLRLLDELAVPNALLVIRPSLLDVASERWGEFATLDRDSDIDSFLQAVSPR